MAETEAAGVGATGAAAADDRGKGSDAALTDAAPPVPTPPPPAGDHAAPTGGGLGALVRAFDWATTSLGPRAAWPESLRTAVDLVLQSPVPMVLLWGADGVMVYNDAYAVFAGARHPRLLGSKVLEGWPEVADFNAQVMRVGLGGGTLSYRDQQLVLHRHGAPEDVWMNLDYSPVLDARGRPAGVLAVVVETTGRVRAERALAVERARLEEVFRRSSSFAVAYRGPEHRYEFVNAAYYGLVGHRRLLGRTLDEAMPEAREQGFAALLDRVYETGEPWVGRETPVWLERTPGAPRELRYVDIVFQPLTEADGTRGERITGVLAHGVEITDHVLARREVERLLTESERARGEAEAANRAKSQFLATMSHELRTPLNAIGGYAELLALGLRGPLTDAQRDDLARIRRANQHLTGLVTDVLNFARLDAGQVEYHLADVELGPLIADVEALVAPQLAAKSLAFDHDACGSGAPGEPHAVRADPEKLRQVLLNLLGNAVKFTDRGGRVALTCETDRAAGVVRVRVSDTGCGIPADRLGTIFEPFVQVDRHRTPEGQQGVGLGLAISRDLARGMGGDLTAESEVEVGTTFTLTLPGA